MADQELSHPESIPEPVRRVFELLGPIGEALSFETNDGMTLLVNRAIEDLTGLAASEFKTDPALWSGLIDPNSISETSDDRESESGSVRWTVRTFRLKHREGDWRWIRSRMLSIPNESGQIAGYLCLHTDITDLKLAEARANRERDRAQGFLDIAGVLIVALGADQKVTLINRKGCQVIGGAEQDILGRNWFDNFVPEVDRERVRAAYHDLMAGDVEIVEYFENAILALDGTEHQISWHNSLLKSTDGEIIGTLSSGLDVTAQRQAEKGLREREEQIRILFESTHSCIAMIEDRVIKYINQAAADAFGYTVEEVIGEDTALIYPTEEAYQVASQAAYPDLESKGYWEGELAYRRKDGSTIWMANYASKLSSGGIVVIMHDITKRVETQAALADQEARLSSIFRSAPIGIGLVVERVFSEVNGQLCDMVGYSSDELLGQSTRMIYASEEDFEFAGRAKAEVILTGGTRSIETRWRRKDGDLIHILLNSTPLDPLNLAKGVSFTALDITTLRQAQADLRLGQDLLERAERIAHVGSFDWNLITDESVASDEAFRVLGVEPGEVGTGFEHFRKFVHPDDLAEVDRMVQQGIMGGGFEFSHRIIRADGAVRVLHHRAQVFYDDDGKPKRMIGTYHDVTNVREAEDALVEKNIALREVLKQITQETDAIKQQIGTNIEESILPTLLRLKEMATPSQAGLLESLHNELDSISSPFLTNLRRRHVQLTPRETEVCRLIKNGLTSKQIADSLGLSVATVHKHREMIRRKLGLANQNVNLASYLQSL